MIWRFLAALGLALLMTIAWLYLMRPLPYQPRSPEVQGVCLLWQKAGYPCEAPQKTTPNPSTNSEDL